MKRLFLDDTRNPEDCINYMNNAIYTEDWIIVRNYFEFTQYLNDHELPDLISFDHDLAIGHYYKNMQEGVINYDSEDFEDYDNKTGYHCAQALVGYCLDKKKLLPKFIVHSMNPVGKENIYGLLNDPKLNGLLQEQSNI